MSRPAITRAAAGAAAVARGCVWTPAKANHPACPECLEQARHILEAAAPYMLAAAWNDGRESWIDCDSENPYEPPL